MLKIIARIFDNEKLWGYKVTDGIREEALSTANEFAIPPHGANSVGVVRTKL